MVLSNDVILLPDDVMLSPGLVKGIKNRLKGKKGVGSQPSFGQLLGDCPMSSEIKVWQTHRVTLWNPLSLSLSLSLPLSLPLSQNVPLVVEMCVREVEEQGLDVEGIYRSEFTSLSPSPSPSLPLPPSLTQETGADHHDQKHGDRDGQGPV